MIIAFRNWRVRRWMGTDLVEDRVATGKSAVDALTKVTTSKTPNHDRVVIELYEPKGEK